jgi:hypothetical protein
MDALGRFLLRRDDVDAAAEAQHSIPAWWSRHQAVIDGESNPLAAAVRAGYACSSLGLAFASGSVVVLHAFVIAWLVVQ